jgi:alpha-beta hydrolase superfamily lysophospholipase
MWILDSLPKLISTARVMIYGFDTKVQGNSSTRGLAALAEELRLSLDLLNENSADQKAGQADDLPSTCNERPACPLVFIAHSLGGIVVREVAGLLM